MCATYYAGQAGDLYMYYGLNYQNGACSGTPRALYLDPPKILDIPPCQYSDARCESFVRHRPPNKHGAAKGYDPAAPVPPPDVEDAQFGDTIEGRFPFGSQHVNLKLYQFTTPLPHAKVMSVGFEVVTDLPPRDEVVSRVKGKCCEVTVKVKGVDTRFDVILRGPPRP